MTTPIEVALLLTLFKNKYSGKTVDEVFDNIFEPFKTIKFDDLKVRRNGLYSDFHSLFVLHLDLDGERLFYKLDNMNGSMVVYLKDYIDCVDLI